jgi:hypothetical protein
LSENSNQHGGCGAAMALFIACAGTGFKETLGVLGLLLKDKVDSEINFISLSMRNGNERDELNLSVNSLFSFDFQANTISS